MAAPAPGEPVRIPARGMRGTRSPGSSSSRSVDRQGARGASAGSASGGRIREEPSGRRLVGRVPLIRLLLATALLVPVATAPAGQLGWELPAEVPPDLPRRSEARAVAPATGPLAGRVHVVYWADAEGRARRVIELLASRPDLPGLPPGLPSRASIYLAPDDEVWDALTGGRAADWSAGVAIPALGRAVIPLFEAPAGGTDARDRTVLHEWAHLGLHEYLEGLRIPRWFDEGYAQRASGGWRIAEAWRLRLGLAGGRAPSLDSLSLEWPRGRAEADLAYLLAGSAVQYLAASSGARGLEVLLATWRQEGDFEEAFRRTFGYSTGAFETRWVEHVRRRYSWVLVAWQTAAFWAFAGLGLLLLARRRVRRSRLELARIRATQPPARPAYWEDPPAGPPREHRATIGRVGPEVDPPAGPR